MPRYYANAESSIDAIFEREGDALTRAGFVYPDLSHMPENVSGGMNGETTDQFIARRAREIHDNEAWANDPFVDPEVNVVRSARLNGLIPDNAANRALLE